MNELLLWGIPVVCLLATFLGIALWTKNPAMAMGIAIPLVFLFPAWAKCSTGIEPIDIKSTATIGMLCLYSFLPGATYPWRLVLADYFMLGLLAVHLISDTYHDGLSLAIPAIAYVEWLVPYLAGRLCFQRIEDVEKIWPVVVYIGGYLAVLSITESVLLLNLLEWLWGERPLERFPRNVLRWGWRRSYVICLHPLYMGVLSIWLWSWMLFGGLRSLRGRASVAWLFLVPLGLVGVLASGSRGPILAIPLVILGAVFCQLPRWRTTLAIGMVCACLLVIWFREPVQATLDVWSGERRDWNSSRQIFIDDKFQEYSSLRTRSLLWTIYRKPFWNSGLLGYGTTNCGTFPVNVPLSAQELNVRRELWMIDNTYLLVALRFGFLGLFSFLGLLLSSLWQWIRIADSPGTKSIDLASTAFGGSISTIFLIGSVWMPYDFGFFLLWMIGASSGLQLQAKSRGSSKRDSTTEFRRKQVLG